MSFEHLPTLADVQSTRRATQKVSKVVRNKRNDAEARHEWQQSGKLGRARANETKKRNDRAKLAKWAMKVKERDGWIDRCDGRHVVRTAELLPRRAEAHHIVPRNDLAVRYDVRNGICLSLENHARVESGQLQIVGTKFFTVEGKRYVDATFPVTFRKVK